MTVTVQLFAGAREIAGRDELRVDAPGGATYADLLRAMVDACPALEPLAAVSRLAADAEYVDQESPVDAGAEIALIPSVSGG